MPAALRSSPLLAAAAAAAAAGGADMCVLFVSESFRGFHFGRVDFANKHVADLLPMPATLTGAGGGVAAGADEGVFYIPNADVAYNDLIEVNIVKNTTKSVTIEAPPAFKGTVPAFYTMQLNTATGDLWALFEESTRISWVDVATVYPANGSSVAISADFAPQWISDFQWRKVGVSTVDSKRGLFYFIGGVEKAGVTVETLVGVPVGDASKPVVFKYVTGPSGNSSDVDFLGYSAPLDLFVAADFSINTGIASIKTLPASADGSSWTTVFVWKPDAEGSMELGDGTLSLDGLTLYVALTSGKTRMPYYVQYDLKANKVVNSFTVPAAQWPGMLTAEVVAC